MAKDFRSDQIRVKAIIGTGSILGAPASVGLALYSGSEAADWKGSTKTNLFTNVGSDVWMYVHGQANNSAVSPGDRAKGSVVLFNGDVVISGTLWSERSIVEVDDAVHGNFQAPHQIIGGHMHLTGGNGIAKLLVDPFTSEPDLSPLGARNGTISFATVQGSSGEYSFDTQFPSKYKDVFFHVSGSRGVKGSHDRGVALFEGDVMVSGNLELAPESIFTVPGDFAIGGDLTVGGNDISGSAGGAIQFETPDPNVVIVHGLKIGNDHITGSDDTVFIAHSGSGDVGIAGELAIAGDYVRNKHGNSVLQFHPSDEFATAAIRRLYVSGVNSPSANAFIQLESMNGTVYRPSWIRFSRNGPPTTVYDPSLDPTGRHNTLGRTEYWGVDSSEVGRAAGMTFMEATADWGSGFGPHPVRWGVSLFGASGAETTVSADKQLIVERELVTVSGSLKIHGGETSQNAKILDGNHNEVMHFSGSGDTTISNNLTVVGDLNVSGSTTSIGTTNLKVSDQLILLASGATSTNTKGGIAIASGSSFDDVSLLWGAGKYANSWRASRLDVQDGTRTTGLDSAGEPVRLEAAGLRFAVGSDAHELLLTASVPEADATKTHMTASVSAGGILLDGTESIVLKSADSIDLTTSNGVNIPDAQALRFGDGVSVTNQSSDTLFVDNAKLRLGTSAGELIFGSSAGNNKIQASASGLLVSGSQDIVIHSALPFGAVSTSSRLVLSASSDDTVGGPVIVLSSSVHTQGGSAGDEKEGFITIGAKVDEIPQLFRPDQYRDVRTFISGTVASTNTNTRGVTLVAGDLLVSGNTDFKGAVNLGAISTNNLTLNSLGSNEPFLRFRDNTVQINRASSGDLTFIDTTTGPHTLSDLASLSVVDNTDVFTILGGEPSFVRTTGSFSFDTDDRYTTSIGADSYFFVSGSVGSKDYSTRPGNGERGTAVFGGDIHVSGSFFADQPTFWTSLHTAYSTPDTMGIKTFSDLSAGAGAVIDTSNTGIPLQLRNPAACDLGIASPGVNESSGPVLSLTGSLDFAYSGGGSNSRIRMQSDNTFEFHNSTGNVFQLSAGSAGTNAQFPNNNRLEFGGASRYVYGHQTDSVNRLSLINTDTGGIVAVNAGGGAGHLAVTGSVLPGADNSYNLGSPSMRWANVYTGDLHLRNDRGNWTIYEEPDMLVVVNNLTGKKYKMGLTPLEDEE